MNIWTGVFLEDLPKVRGLFKLITSISHAKAPAMKKYSSRASKEN